MKKIQTKRTVPKQPIKKAFLASTLQKKVDLKKRIFIKNKIVNLISVKGEKFKNENTLRRTFKLLQRKTKKKNE